MVMEMSREELNHGRSENSNMFAEVVAWQFGTLLGPDGLQEIVSGFKKMVASSKVGTCPRVSVCV